MFRRVLVVGLILGVGLALAGCFAPIRLALVVTPTSAIVDGGGTVTLTATDSSGNPVTVTWNVSSGPGTISAAGVYTAPSTVSAVTNATVTATRVSGPAITGSATVTIRPPLGIVVTPTSATVEGGGTVAFTATDTDGAPVTVTWSVSSGPGTINASGVYTAPASVSIVTNATVTAARTDAPTITASATVTIKPEISAGLVDSPGDTFGANTYDIVSITTSRSSTTLTVVITFDPLTPPSIPLPGSTAGPGDLVGFIDFDIDEDDTTGVVPATSLYCPCSPSSAIGSELFVSLFARNASGNYDIIATATLANIGDAVPSLTGDVLTLTIPLTDLGGDDGITDMTAVVGANTGPTDCLPDAGVAVVTSIRINAVEPLNGEWFPHIAYLINLGGDWGFWQML